jgi:hypothetical protein
MKVSDLFDIYIAKSHAYNKYERGNAVFVTNGFNNNGIQGFVKPMQGDRIFKFKGICVSAFCEATVQSPPFIGRGNGGSGVIVLEPLEKMLDEQLFSYASYFNRFIKWRFSYGRMVTKDRITNLELPKIEPKAQIPKINDYLPTKNQIIKSYQIKSFRSISLKSLFTLKSGDYHNAGALPNGNVPLVSCGDSNNGVMRLVKVPENNVYENTLTIAYNGQPLTTKYHPYKFAAKDDVAVCILNIKLKASTLTFLQFILNSEMWRFSFGRKCFREKLSQMTLNLPVNTSGEIDEEIIEKIVKSTSYWNFLESSYSKGIVLKEDVVD